MFELKGNFEMESTSYDSTEEKKRNEKGEKRERERVSEEKKPKDAGARSTAKCHYVFIVAIEIEESRRHYNFVQFSRFTSKERDFRFSNHCHFPVFIMRQAKFMIKR